MKGSDVMTIGKLVLTLVIFAGVAIAIVPILLGAGTQAGTALGVSTEIAVAEQSGALNNASSAMNTVFGFLPWLGVGLVVMGALGIRKIM